MNQWVGLLLWASLIFAPSSFAQVQEICVAKMENHEFVVQISEKEVGFETRAFLEELELPAAGPCYEMKRPSTNFWRCAHRGDLFDLEVYPQVTTASGSVKGPQAILWLGAQPQTLELICEESLQMIHIN